jgi:hypothetical protein
MQRLQLDNYPLASEVSVPILLDRLHGIAFFDALAGVDRDKIADRKAARVMKGWA